MATKCFRLLSGLCAFDIGLPEIGAILCTIGGLFAYIIVLIMILHIGQKKQTETKSLKGHNMKPVIICSLGLFVMATAYADCDTNSISYLNCNAGQLVDICDNTAYWKKKIDCCDDNSNYGIFVEQISVENKEFYSPYINRFDKESYHCALKIGEINNNN